MGPWAPAGALHPGVTAREATGLVWAFIGADAYRLLVVERGWSQRRFETLVAAMLERQLLVKPSAPD